MSIKRQAPTDLNHENWDQEEPEEQKDMGKFQAAPKEVLEKRVMRTAKRRNQGSTNEPGKSVFSGFGGFNKAQPSSFDFLANLTNGSKTSNGSAGASSSETFVASGLFVNKPTSPTEGLFKVPASTPPSKPSSSILSTTSPFGATAKISPSALFSASKSNSTSNDSPFKIQPVSTSDDSQTNTGFSSKPTANVLSVQSTLAGESKPTNSSPFNIQPVVASSTTTAMVQTSFGISTKPTSTSTTPEKKPDDKSDEKKMKYYSKLKGLNQSVSEWISKHVSQTPLCILSPIFKDYEKYLKEMTEELHGSDTDESNKATESEALKVTTVNDTKAATPVSINNTGSLFSSGSLNSTSKPSVFGVQNSVSSSTDAKSFSFGIKTSANSTSNTTTTNTGFSFGVTTSTASPNPSPFALNNNDSSTNQTTTTPFSFGVGKPFSFNPSNVQQTSTETAAENDEDEPPKVEFTPVKEDNSVFDKKCKIFVKKDNNFVDKGVGTLYIKKIEESGKHQLLVRANTNLGTVLLNLVLASAIPTQRMGKNNVMLVCIPTPDAKPPPTPVLIRVKTGEEADELLTVLNKYKA